MAGKSKRSLGDLSSMPPSSPTLRDTIYGLRADSLSCREGELIGSEDQLLARHKISRPTLRKAAALVAQEQLLEIRRGVGGGYIARRPTGKAVAHMAAIYLSAHNANIDQILETMEPIRIELTRLAAERIDEASREAFERFLQHDEAITDNNDLVSFGKLEREYGRVLGAASGNVVLALFQEIVFDLAGNISRADDIYRDRPDRIASYRARRRKVTEAILEGESNLATLLSKRGSEINWEWRSEDREAKRVAKAS